MYKVLITENSKIIEHRECEAFVFCGSRHEGNEDVITPGGGGSLKNQALCLVILESCLFERITKEYKETERK